MDLKAFSQDSFEIKNWINNIFNHQEAKECTDVKQFASCLVMKLQLATQEVNNSIEDSSSQIVTTLPRVLRDIDALAHEATILKSQMTAVKKDIEEVEHNTAASMQTLVQLDTVKGRLSASSQALKEADNWTTLSSDIEEVMDNGDIDQIASKLIALQSCLSILSHVADYEERVAHLEGLKVRLEALLSPHLVAAFAKHDLDESTKLARILNALGRSGNLVSYYHKCETQQLQLQWTTCFEGHDLSGLPVWLATFYELLSSLIAKQVRWCESVFDDSDASMLLGELASLALRSLDPSPAHVVSVSVKQQNDPLAFIAAVKTIGDDFIRDFDQAVAYQQFSDPLLTSLRESVRSAALEPVKDQMQRYEALEEATLLSHLISADITRDDVCESLRLLREYSTKLLPQTEAAVGRCMQLSGGLAACGLVRAVRSLLSAMLERLSHMAARVDRQTASIQDDWTVFSTCLTLIQTAGEFAISVDSLELCLSDFVVTASKANVASTEASNQCANGAHCVTEAQQNDFVEMAKRLTDDNDFSLLSAESTASQGECERSVAVALGTMLAPIATQLTAVPSLAGQADGGQASTTLSASYSPQEYITQIGQYVMTLPQHLEPLMMNQSPALHRALQEADVKTGSDALSPLSESESSAAHALIGRVARRTAKLYSDVILKMPIVVPQMITQITTDIDYISSIFEDLGVISLDPLDQLQSLLRVPADQFWNVVPSNNPRLVAAVRQMREIPAKS